MLPPQLDLDRVTVTIEVPRGSFVKRRPDGSVDFVSPLPSPFNYGSVVGIDAPDGDPLDALVLGRRLRAGTQIEVQVWGHAEFVDAGLDDPKLVCTRGAPPTRRQWRRVHAFFVVYARVKGALNRARGRAGPTQMHAMVRR